MMQLMTQVGQDVLPVGSRVFERKMAAKKKAKITATQSKRPNVDWSTPAARVAWILEQQFNGNRSAFAEAIGFSHTIISRVAAGQAPGRRLLSAIAERLRANPTWLLTGTGQPFSEPVDASGHAVLPETDVLLPGPPLEYQHLLTKRSLILSEDLFSATQYWLRLKSTEPLVEQATFGFCAGDQLLFETDPRNFPREKQLGGQLCIVRFPHEVPELRLAAVTYCAADSDTGPERLEVNTFSFQDVPPNRLVREIAYRHYPNGTIRQEERFLQLIPFRNAERAVPLDDCSPPRRPEIQYANIVAVWLYILRRTWPLC